MRGQPLESEVPCAGELRFQRKRGPEEWFGKGAEPATCMIRPEGCFVGDPLHTPRYIFLMLCMHMGE